MKNVVKWWNMSRSKQIYEIILKQNQIQKWSENLLSKIKWIQSPQKIHWIKKIQYCIEYFKNEMKIKQLLYIKKSTVKWLI